MIQGTAGISAFITSEADLIVMLHSAVLAGLLRTACPSSLTTLQHIMHCDTDPCKDGEYLLQSWNNPSPLRQVSCRVRSADVCRDSETAPRANSKSIYQTPLSKRPTFLVHF
jgi:hypothetical protein